MAVMIANVATTTATATVLQPLLRYGGTETVQVTPLRRTLASSP